MREHEQQQFLERDLAVRAAIRGAGEPVGRGHAAAVDGHDGEDLREREQHAVDGLRTHRLLECRERIAESVRVEPVTPIRDREMRGFVEQSQREQVGGRGTGAPAPRGVQRGGEAMRGRRVCEDGTARRREQRLIEAAAVSGGTRDVELVGERRSAQGGLLSWRVFGS